LPRGHSNERRDDDGRMTIMRPTIRMRGRAMPIKLSHLWAWIALLAFAAGSRDTGHAAVDPVPPGAAACTALGVAEFATVTTLSTAYEAGSTTLPAHCVVRGAAAPHTGVDGKAYETRFELRLPTRWSGRFLYQGGGGNDGTVAPQHRIVSRHRPAARLRRRHDGCRSSGRNR
jgi:hypothetical protein